VFQHHLPDSQIVFTLFHEVPWSELVLWARPGIVRERKDIWWLPTFRFS